MSEVFQTFYAEFTDDPRSWASPCPSFDMAKFNAELERRAGVVGSVPRFRLRWAGDTDDYILEDCYKLTGYTYLLDGQEVFISCMQKDFEFPDGATVAPFFETHKIFTPRFVIEEYQGFLYQKAWFVELVEKIGVQYGRIDVMSHYREPSERDMQMAEQLNYLRETLNEDDIRNGIEKMNALEAKEKKERHDEMVDEMAEDVVQALSDPPKNAVPFAMPQNFNALERIRQITEEGKI